MICFKGFFGHPIVSDLQQYSVEVPNAFTNFSPTQEAPRFSNIMYIRLYILYI